MNVRLGPTLLLGAILLAAVSASAREVLTPEEQAERELEKKRAAPPVLVCQPTALSITVGRGETRALRLSIRNTGGRVLSWAVLSAPKWITPDRRAGELGFGKKRSLVLTIDPEGLPGGGTTGSVVIEARDESEEKAEGSPVTVRVTVDVPAEEPEVAPAKERPPQPGPVAAEVPTPEKTPPAPAEPAGPAKPRSWRIGLQGGLLGPLPGTDQDFRPAPFGVLVFRFGVLSGPHDDGRRWGLELAEGWSEFDSADADDSSSRLLIFRARGLFPVGPERLYLTAGGGLFSEEADYPGTDYKEHLRGTVDLGAMYRLGGRFELGASYTIVIGSENVPGLFEFGAGVMF